MHVAKRVMVSVMQAGELDMVVSLGDDALEAGVRWPLGSIDFSPTPGDSGAKSAAAVQTAAQLDAQPKPEIHHIFRKPDRRPPAAISMLFAAAAVAIPAVFLSFRLYQLGVNLKVNWCTSVIRQLFKTWCTATKDSLPLQIGLSQVLCTGVSNGRRGIYCKCGIPCWHRQHHWALRCFLASPHHH